MKPLNFAVIGCGMLARQTHLPTLTSLPEAQLHTCCDLSEESLAACHSFSPQKLRRDFEAAVEDPEVDALVVATTEHFRVTIIEAAAKAGKPVYCEKPLADSLANARKIEELVEDSGIPFCVGHNRRCSPAMVEAQAIFSAHMARPEPLPWRYERPGFEAIPVGDNDGKPLINIRINDDWKSWKAIHTTSELNREAGLLLSEGTHFTDIANWFLQDQPVRVFATGQGIVNHVMVIEYARGGLATLSMSASGSFAYPKELIEAMGNAGVVVVDHMLEIRTAGIAHAPLVKKFDMLGDTYPETGSEGGLHGWLAKRQRGCEEAERTGDPMKQFCAEPNKGHALMLKEFIREIRGKREPVSPVGNAILALRVCLTAVESLRQGKPVDLID